MIIQHHITDDGAELRGLGIQSRVARTVLQVGRDVRVGEGAEGSSARETSAGLMPRVRQMQLVRDGLGAAIARTSTQMAYLDQIDAALSRMTELGRRASESTLSPQDRAAVREEFGRLGRRVEDLAARRFEGEPLFDGSVREVSVDTRGRTVAVAAPALDRPVYTQLRTAGVDTPESAAAAVQQLEAAASALLEDRAQLRNGYTALVQAGEALQVEEENLAAASLRLRDARQVENAVRQISTRLLVHSSEPLLAQGHPQPERALRLLE